MFTQYRLKSKSILPWQLPRVMEQDKDPQLDKEDISNCYLLGISVPPIPTTELHEREPEWDLIASRNHEKREFSAILYEIRHLGEQWGRETTIW